MEKKSKITYIFLGFVSLLGILSIKSVKAESSKELAKENLHIIACIFA